jgi:hypothetical protein
VRKRMRRRKGEREEEKERGREGYFFTLPHSHIP